MLEEDALAGARLAEDDDRIPLRDRQVEPVEDDLRPVSYTHLTLPTSDLV